MNPKPKFDKYGNKRWYNDDGFYHREDGPAIELIPGTKQWYRNGKPHRKDGPAVERADGTKSWYYNGKEIKCSSTEEFVRLIKLRTFW